MYHVVVWQVPARSLTTGQEIIGLPLIQSARGLPPIEPPAKHRRCRRVIINLNRVTRSGCGNAQSIALVTPSSHPPLQTKAIITGSTIKRKSALFE
jgi:hypothetical protein